MTHQYNGGGYGNPTPLGLPIDQQHSAHQASVTQADLKPAPSAPSEPKQEEK